MFGKAVSSLQEDITVDESNEDEMWITGQLNYQRDYTGFSSDVSKQAGYFLALKFTAPEGWTTTVEIVNGTSGPVTLDSDMGLVSRIDDGENAITVISTDGTSTISKIYHIHFTLSETGVLSIQTPPTKTTYVEGEELDLAGMIIEASYHIGSGSTTNVEAAVEAGMYTTFEIIYQTEGATAFTAGDTKVTINWDGQLLEQPVTVTEAAE